MKCPKCVGKLKEKIIENVKANVCWVCEGIWFDEGELEKVIVADSKNLKFIDLDREELDGKEASGLYKELDAAIGKCPKCTEEIKLERTNCPKGIFVDICPKCEGVWLDGGEIKKMRDRTLVKLADCLYAFKTDFVGKLQLLFQGRKKGKDLNKA